MTNDPIFFKGRISLLLIVLICFGLIAGCSSVQDTDYSDVDLQGTIIEMNAEETMILVEDQKQDQIWVDVSNLNDRVEQLHSPLEVNVWLNKPINEENPAIAKAERVDVIK